MCTFRIKRNATVNELQPFIQITCIKNSFTDFSVLNWYRGINKSIMENVPVLWVDVVREWIWCMDVVFKLKSNSRAK